MKRPHYAWCICLGGVLTLAISMGLAVNVFSIYQPVILVENGFTNAQGSWITTTRTLFIVVALLTVNQLCTRLSLRTVMTLGPVLVGLSCLLFSVARSFPVYCCAAAVTGIGYCYGGMVPLSLIIGRWFRDRRSLALAIASAGSGLSTILAPSLITRVIQSRGMQTAFRWEGLVILLLSGLIWLVLRDSPDQLGMTPYHLGGASAPLPPSRPQPPRLRRSQTAALLAALFLIGVPGGPGFSHLTVLFTSQGYDSRFVATLISLLGLLLTLGKILCGQINDRFGGRRGNYFVFGVYFLGLLLCCLTPLARGGTLLPTAAITVFALGLPVTAIYPTLWASDLYGDRDYAQAVRALTMAYTIGMLVSGPIPGVLADRFGSYIPGYILCTLALVAAFCIIQPLYFKQGVGKKPA